MILLANPNANPVTTAAMCAIAAPWLADLQGWTAPTGPQVIVTPDQLDRAADGIAALHPPAACRGVIVAAFGDPGADRLAARLAVPVIGIGPQPRGRRRRGARLCGRDHHPCPAGPDRRADAGAARPLSGLSHDRQPDVMRDPDALDHALLDAVMRAAAAGAEAVIIGGGPLAQAAVRLAPLSPVPLIQPVPEAARAMARLLPAEVTGPRSGHGRGCRPGTGTPAGGRSGPAPADRRRRGAGR